MEPTTFEVISWALMAGLGICGSLKFLSLLPMEQEDSFDEFEDFGKPAVKRLPERREPVRIERNDLAWFYETENKG